MFTILRYKTYTKSTKLDKVKKKQIKITTQDLVIVMSYQPNENKAVVLKFI